MNTTKPNTDMQLNAQQGVTLIEVLVTMLIAAIGLLGAGGLQLASTRYQQTAAMRSQAMIQAQFITEKVKANSSAVIAAAPPTPASTYLAPDGYALATVATLPADPGCGVNAQPACTGAQAAVKDMRDWRLALQALPGGRGSIFPLTSAGFTDPVTRQVVVMWQEKQQNEAGTATDPNPNASLVDITCPVPRVGGVRCLTFLVTP